MLGGCILLQKSVITFTRIHSNYPIFPPYAQHVLSDAVVQHKLPDVEAVNAQPVDFKPPVQDIELLDIKRLSQPKSSATIDEDPPVLH